MDGAIDREIGLWKPQVYRPVAAPVVQAVVPPQN